MASSTAAARLRELAPGPGAGISAAALAECCAGLLGGGGGDAEAARSALDTLCAAGGEALRRHADELTPLVVGRLGDGDAAVREAARRFLVLLMEMKEMNARLENIQTDSSRSDVEHNNSVSAETESSDTNQVRKSLKQKISTRDMSLVAGEGDTTKKSVEPIKVFSEKDLIKETGKVMSTLQPDNEWSIRITAMQRVEGIVLGGAADYSAFPMLLKQLVTPLITQLLDRRSTVVKQACHLLNFLSKELLRDFEPCAELLILALLKNVVITVLVIAESADKCIKEMLRNCKVSRILPKIIEFAKNDRSAVLRVRCCEYAILMLEHWVDTPELQRSANLYEDLIKCCIEDATSEVRSGARACYRMFSRIWPERSHQLFSSFEPSRQKMINDDHDAETNQKQLSAIERVSTAMDKVVKVDSRTSFSSGDLQSARVKISLQHDDMASESPAEDSKDGTSAIGSSFEDTSTLGKEIILDRDPDKCDSGIGSSPCYLPSDTAFEPTPDILSSEANIVTTFQDKAECRPNVKQITSRQVQASGGPSQLLRLSPSIRLEDSENLLNKTPVKANSDGSSGGKLGTQQVERHRVGTPHKGVVHKEPKNNHAPNFRRPLLSKQMTNWFYGSTRGDLDSKQLILNEMVNSMDVPSSLTGALSVGLDPKSDWMMRVYAFNFLQQSLLEQSPKGIQEVAQNFEKVMRFVSRYLDDPHHKVAHAALSSLAEIMPFFKKPFEHYLDQMLPRVFSRLSDPKESIKQQCLEVLTLAGENYSIDSLLPALLRSLDEQKSPKSRLAVLEFAKSSFAKCTTDPDISSSSSFLKLWLGKLTLLFKDRNSKVKEAAVIGLSSIYSHYDPASMLSFLVSLPMEEQKRLTRAMKQLIPMIGSDLEEFLQQKRHRQKVPFFDRFAATDPHPGSYIGKQNKSQQHDIAYQSNYVRADDVFSSAVQYIPSFPSELHDRRHAGKIEPEPYGRRAEMIDKRSSTTRLSSGVPGRSYYSVLSEDTVKSQSIPQTYHQDAASLPEMNGRPVPIKNLHQMSSPLLKMLDDPDESTREFALSLLVEILEKQEKALDNCIETLVVKLLLATKDPALKVVNQAHVCLTMVVTRSDPLKCLRAIASQLGSNDEKILTVSINSLSKLVARLSQKDLMTHLSAFLPALLDAFEIRSPYARKAILLCVVEAYVKLGPALLPHLEQLDGAQLQLVVTTSHSRRRSIAAGNDK